MPLVVVNSSGNLWTDIRLIVIHLFRYVSCQHCFKGKNLFKKHIESEEEINYSSGESDTEFAMLFHDLDTDEKRQRL